MDVFLILLAIVVLVVVVAALLIYLSAKADKPNEVRMTENGYLEIPTFIRRSPKISVKDVSASEPVANPADQSISEPASNPRIIRCRFKFVCARKWQDLESTESDDVKFCTHCEQSVYMAKTIEVFDQLSDERKCTYWAGSKDGRGPYLDMPLMGRLVPKIEVEPSFVVRVYRFFTAKWF
jgi:uncharacterized protein YxeA